MKYNTILDDYPYFGKLTFNFIVLLFLITALSGCSSTSEKIFNEKNYVVGDTVTVTQGNAIASELSGEVESKRNWVGVMHSDDGWGRAYLTFSDDYIERKLYYLGFDQDVLHLMYREYRQGKEYPSINLVRNFDSNQTPYVSLNDFYLKIVGKGSPASFLILDQPTWVNKKNKFRLAEDKRKKEEKFEMIVQAISSIRNKAQTAKRYAEQFKNFTPSFSSFSQAATEFDDLNALFNEARKMSYSIDQRIGIYQKIKNQFPPFAQFFTLVATALEGWYAMDDDFRKAAQSGIEKEYFTMALDIKVSGEQALQVEQFAKAIQKFKRARQEVSSIMTYFQNAKESNLE